MMHVEQNICDNIIGTLLDIPRKKKDHSNACFDLNNLGIRKKLQPNEIKDGKKSKFAKAFSS